MTVNSVAKHFWYTSRKCSAKSPATLNACTQPRTICSRSLVIKSMKQEKRLVQRCNNIRQRFYSVNSDRVIINSPGILKECGILLHFAAFENATSVQLFSLQLQNSVTMHLHTVILHELPFSLYIS